MSGWFREGSIRNAAHNTGSASREARSGRCRQIITVSRPHATKRVTTLPIRVSRLLTGSAAMPTNAATSANHTNHNERRLYEVFIKSWELSGHAVQENEGFGYTWLERGHYV